MPQLKKNAYMQNQFSYCCANSVKYCSCALCWGAFFSVNWKKIKPQITRMTIVHVSIPVIIYYTYQLEPAWINSND